mmetsp:Transcript_62384/g.190744  ORF Transcript_62384/g.190744 Transcript_62384/m.190744 type:complete len:228 (-) Transcript_62384:169-852(-)
MQKRLARRQAAAHEVNKHELNVLSTLRPIVWPYGMNDRTYHTSASHCTATQTNISKARKWKGGANTATSVSAMVAKYTAEVFARSFDVNLRHWARGPETKKDADIIVMLPRVYKQAKRPGCPSKTPVTAPKLQNCIACPNKKQHTQPKMRCLNPIRGQHALAKSSSSSLRRKLGVNDRKKLAFSSRTPRPSNQRSTGELIGASCSRRRKDGTKPLARLLKALRARSS